MDLDFMVVADYVRSDNAVISMMGAGIDTVAAPVVPGVQPLGIAVRMLFDTSEPVGTAHRLTISFVSADGNRLLSAAASFQTPPQPPGVPPHWKRAVGIALQIPIPMPDYGDYAFELDIDDGAITKSIDFRIVRPSVPPGASLIPPPAV